VGEELSRASRAPGLEPGPPFRHCVARFEGSIQRESGMKIGVMKERRPNEARVAV
jgi:hypothetical protein